MGVDSVTVGKEVIMKKSGNGIMRRADGVELKDHVACLLEEIDKRYEQRFEAQEEATRAALASAQLAVDKAEETTREWQRNSNEWRTAMGDKDKLFATKAEILPRLEKFDVSLGELKTIRDITIGKASQNAMLFTALIAILGVVLGLVQLFGK
jgi:hypothetical protein